jgi:hypothetical protein
MFFRSLMVSSGPSGLRIFIAYRVARNRAIAKSHGSWSSRGVEKAVFCYDQADLIAARAKILIIGPYGAILP